MTQSELEKLKLFAERLKYLSSNNEVLEPAITNPNDNTKDIETYAEIYRDNNRIVILISDRKKHNK